MSITVANADTYFVTNLGKTKWDILSDTEKAAALAMAEEDVINRLGDDAIDETVDNQLKAVYEQAVYLGSNYGVISAPQEVTEIDIYGASREKYRRNPDIGFSPRATMFLRRILGVPRFGRG